MSNYWTKSSIGRRGLLRGAAIGGVGLAGAALVGCGSDDDGSAPASTATAAAGGTTAAGGTATASEPKRGGTLTLQMGGEPRSLDPHFDTFPYNTWITNATHSNLVKFVPDLSEIVPDAAEALPEIPDDLTYVFKIKPGIKFQNIAPLNGRELTSADVKYAIERQSNQAGDEEGTYQHAYYFKDKLSAIETPDDHTIIFKTNEPYAAFMNYMASPWTAMIAHEIVEQYGNLTEHSIGTGPFILKEWQKEVRFSLERNPDYFVEGKPYVDKLEYLVSTDADTAATQFIDKQYQAITVGQSQLERVKNARGADTDYSVSPSQFWRQFRMPPTDEGFGYLDYKGTENDSAAVFDDIRVREAVVRAIDSQQVLDLVYLGDGQLTYGPILPQFEYWALKEELAGFDLTKAAQLLDAAGVTSLRGPMMWASTNPQSDQIGEVLKEQLAKINVTTDLEPMELAAYYNKTYAYRYTMSHHVPLNSPEPDENLSSYFGKNSTYYKHYNTEIFDLVNKQSKTVDRAERQTIVLEAQRKIVQDFPIKFMFTTNQHQFAVNTLKGYEFVLDRYDGSNVVDAWLDT